MRCSTLRRGLIRRARNVLRGQEFEGEPEDRVFDGIIAIQYDFDERTAIVSHNGSHTRLEGVYAVSGLDKMTPSDWECSTFEAHRGFDMSWESPIEGQFEEARGRLNLWEP